MYPQKNRPCLLKEEHQAPSILARRSQSGSMSNTTSGLKLQTTLQKVPEDLTWLAVYFPICFLQKFQEGYISHPKWIVPKAKNIIPHPVERRDSAGKVKQAHEVSYLD